MSEVGRRFTSYPPPPENGWEALQRYVAVKALADGIQAEEKRLLGVFDEDPAERWQRAEVLYERLAAGE